MVDTGILDWYFGKIYSLLNVDPPCMKAKKSVIRGETLGRRGTPRRTGGEGEGEQRFHLDDVTRASLRCKIFAFFPASR